MNCAEAEILICDYVDGALGPEQKAALERHMAQCPACAELAADSAAGLAFIGRAADVEPPPELITRILFEAPWSTHKAKQTGWRKWMSAALSPILQPKFAMGMAMTVLSLSMLLKYTPVSLKPKDWQPAKILQNLEVRAGYAWGRTVKFYENLKFVYQIQTTLRQWQQQQQDEEQQPAAKNAEPADEHKLPQKSSPAPAGTGSSKP